MKHTILPLFVFYLLITQTASALPASQDSLLTRYRQMAIGYNDDLKAAERNIQASIALEKAALTDRLPVISAGGDFKFTGNPMELSMDIKGVGPVEIKGGHFNYGISATLLQPVYTGGYITESIRMARSQVLVAEAEMELLRSAVCYQLDVQYWTTVARNELMNVAGDFLDAISDLERVVSERVEAGLTDIQELLTVQVKRNEAEYLYLQIQNDFKIGVMALNSLIGLPLDNPTPVGSGVLTINGIPDILQDCPERPEIRIATQNITMSEQTMRMNDSRYKPQIHLGAGGGIYAPGYNFRPDLSPNYTVYAKVEIPIFHSGKRRMERRAYEQLSDSARDALHKVTNDIHLEINQASLSLGQARQRVDLALSSLDKAEENERRAIEKYEEGTISIADVIDAQVYRLNAQNNYVTAKTAARISLTELIKAANGYNIE